MSDPLVSVRGIEVTLGAAPVLRGIDLDVPVGQMLAVMGPNGSGKSTLIKALVGVRPISRGSATLFGVDVTRDHRAVPWERVGYVPQRLTATSGVPATCAETVAAGLLSGRRLFPGKDVHARCVEALERVGLADRARDPMHVLSGGQQQRVLLARAIVREPDLLILDEPLSGMDARSQDATRDLLVGMVGSGASVVVVLHETGPLGGDLDRALVLRHGRVVHDGDPPPAAAGHAGVNHEHAHDPTLRLAGSPLADAAPLASPDGLRRADG